jgi:hypothetical protein
MRTTKHLVRAGRLGLALLMLPVLCLLADRATAQDYSGEWRIIPQIHYDCPACLIHFDRLQIAHSGTSLTIIPDGPDPGPMSGSVTGSGSFAVHVVESIPCTIDYHMWGLFTGPARFQAEFDVNFDFFCAPCTDRHWSLIGWRVWADWGAALAGTHGEPALSGAGELLAGQLVSLSLSNALENAPATLVIGLSAIEAPFKGGVLVPAPDVLIFGLVTGSNGELDLSSPWPSGLPPGFTIVFQYWVSDPAGPQGFSASNGLSGTTPP